MDRSQFRAALQSSNLEITPDRWDLFERFESALYGANQVMNLTRVPREESWLRHFIDSLLFQDLMPAGCHVLDIGTGPGFPSWPLAWARPDLNVTALDSSGKMLGFLRSQPLPNLEIVQARAEDFAERDRFDVVTGRAVAPLPIQLEISAPFAKGGGVVLPMRTPSEESAIHSFPASKLGLKLQELVSRALPGTDIVRLAAKFEKVGPTPKAYPRSWAEIKRKPIG